MQCSVYKYMHIAYVHIDNYSIPTLLGGINHILFFDLLCMLLDLGPNCKIHASMWFAALRAASLKLPVPHFIIHGDPPSEN